MRHGEEMLLVFAEGTPSAAGDVPGGARPVVVADAAHVRPAVEARRRAAALAHQDRAQRGPARQVRAEVRHAAHRLRLHPPRPRTCAATRDRAVGDRRDRLGAAEGDVRQPRPRQRPRIGDAARHWTTPAGVRGRAGGGRRRCAPRDCLAIGPGAIADGPAVGAVDDPEYPGVSIVDLGLVEDVRIDGGVEVDLVPTFSGCPALAMIAADVRRAVGARRRRRRRRRARSSTPAWTPARITAAGRAGSAPTSASPSVAARRPSAPLRRRSLVEQSMFGPVRCRSVHRCPACGEIVETIRRE